MEYIGLGVDLFIQLLYVIQNRGEQDIKEDPGSIPDSEYIGLVDSLIPLIRVLQNDVEAKLKKDSTGNSGQILGTELANLQAENEIPAQIGPDEQPAVVVPDDVETIGASVLPEDNERRVVTLPLRSIARPQNMKFRKRAHALEDIHQNLSSPGGTCVVHGVSGVGKTSLAVEYVYSYR